MVEQLNDLVSVSQLVTISSYLQTGADVVYKLKKPTKLVQMIDFELSKSNELW